MGRDEEFDYGLAPGERFEPAPLDEEPFDLAQPHVMTALGPIVPDELGVCLVQEPLLTRPPGAAFDPDLDLTDPYATLAELEDYYNAGGRALVTAAPTGAGSDLEGLRWLAARAPVHLILVTGYQRELYALAEAGGAAVAEMAAAMIRDLRDGIAGTPARAGAILAGTSLHAVTPLEARVLRAAARAHLATGAPILTATERGTMALEHLQIFYEEGIDLRRVAIGNLDRRRDDTDYLRAVLDAGAFVAFDNIGNPHQATDEARAAAIARLVEAGYGDQILLAAGLSRRSLLRAFGGGLGPGHAVERFPLMLMEAGLPAAAVRSLLVENPVRALTIRRPGG